MRCAWVVITGLAIAAGGCVAPDPELESASRPIISGPVHTGDPAIMSLLSFKGNTGSRCTATLITPRLLIAAAHCITEAPDFDRHVFPGNNDQNGAAKDMLAVKTVVYDQRYVGMPRQGNDFSIIVLEQPLSIPPMRLNRAPVESAQGKTVRYVGYGLSVIADPGSGGVKRQNSAPLGAVSRLLLTVGPNAHIVCKGDSGGPLLLPDGQGGETIIGIGSFVDAPACRNNTWYQRVDTQLAWIDEQIKKYDPDMALPPDGGASDTGAPGMPDAGTPDLAPPPPQQGPDAQTPPPGNTTPVTAPPADARPVDSPRAPGTTPMPAPTPITNVADGGGCSLGARPEAGPGCVLGLLFALALAARRVKRSPRLPSPRPRSTPPGA